MERTCVLSSALLSVSSACSKNFDNVKKCLAYYGSLLYVYNLQRSIISLTNFIKIVKKYWIFTCRIIKINMPSVDSLKKLAVQIALGGGLVTFAMINATPYITNKKLKETDVYQQAMKMIRNHPEAIKYLGEPIVEGTVNVKNPETYGSDEDKGWFCIPIKGPKSTGSVYCESKFKKDKEKVNVELAKVELTLKSVPGYKLMIKRAE